MAIHKNMGRFDRTIRFIVGVVLIGLYFFTEILTGTIGTIALVFSIVLIGTSFIGICGLYIPFQYRTCEPHE
ncbi:MAG: DUF2892 domain-containing protein [Bacteroidetes bacterium]|nr:DUF2892 domain-containing protein [Bacteroidota bacterium]MDA1332774.1 DUF2892 domain-containing protein [Bacteroidota bacterium]